MASTPEKSKSIDTDNLALVLGGGGARAAYQVGFLRCLAENIPDLRIPIITGFSAGAINAAYLANYPGSFPTVVNSLVQTWSSLTVDKVFRVDAFSLLKNMLSWSFQLLFGVYARSSRVQGVVSTKPLRQLLIETLGAENGHLSRIEGKLQNGRLQAIAISTTNYTTGETVTWIQGCDIQDWQRPNRVGKKTCLTVDHTMASAAIPVFFPAVKIDGHWHGDGGIRLYAPLSPAIHLGADRILAISTRYHFATDRPRRPVIKNYPPLAQIAGIIMNSIFLDVLDQDADRLERTNRLLRRLPEDKRDGKRLIDLFVLRPSKDLGQLAARFEPKLPAMFRFLMRKQGSRETASPDWLSMVMFQPDYLKYLIELGERDAQDRKSEIEDFLA